MFFINKKKCNFILIPRVVPKKAFPFSIFVFIFTQRWDFLGGEVEELPNRYEMTIIIIIATNLNLIHEMVLL